MVLIPSIAAGILRQNVEWVNVTNTTVTKTCLFPIMEKKSTGTQSSHSKYQIHTIPQPQTYSDKKPREGSENEFLFQFLQPDV